MADEGTKKDILLTKKGVLPQASTDAVKDAGSSCWACWSSGGGDQRVNGMTDPFDPPRFRASPRTRLTGTFSAATVLEEGSYG